MDLEETCAFLAVLDHGSFKAAAESLGQSRATLRRRVESLEARIGVALVERSSNGVEVTAAGRLFARHGRALLRETLALVDALRELDEEEPRGSLRVGVPTTLPAELVALLFGAFRAKFPRIQVEIHVAADPGAELLEQVDVVLTLAPIQPIPRWTSVPLIELREGLRASASYLERRGTPQTLEDLVEHELLAAAATTDHQRWPLLGGGSVAITPALIAQDVGHLRRFASSGFGIGLLLELGHPLLEDDELVAVLDDQVGRRLSLRALVPDTLIETPKLRAIVGHLQGCLVARERRPGHDRRPPLEPGLWPGSSPSSPGSRRVHR